MCVTASRSGLRNPDYPEARRRLKPGAILIRDENGEERMRYTQTDYFATTLLLEAEALALDWSGSCPLARRWIRQHNSPRNRRLLSGRHSRRLPAPVNTQMRGAVTTPPLDI